MPELPEVETTVRGLNKSVKGQKITDVWSDYFLNTTHGHKQNLKNKVYFENFRTKVIDSKIIVAKRKGKNILLELSGDITILTHLKMTGHFLYGNYQFDKLTNTWHTTETGPLADPFNRFIHLVFTLSNKKHLVLSDVRRFAKVVLLEGTEKATIENLGPDPLGKLTQKSFEGRLKSKLGPIKSILMDQNVLSGMGNIYSDEMLWKAGVHPEETVKNINNKQFSLMFKAMKEVLQASIKVGGDSTSDYRQIDGRPGGFQNKHKVYRRKNHPCQKRGCNGIIERIVVRGRSAHFCPVHQKKVIL